MTRAAIVLAAAVASLALPALATAAEPAADQYRPGVAGAGGDKPTDEVDGASQGGFDANAEAAAAATAPDFNIIRNDTDGGGRGGLVFLLALGAALLLGMGFIIRSRRAGSMTFPVTATPSPPQG